MDYEKLKRKAKEIAGLPEKAERAKVMRGLTKNGYTSAEKSTISQYINNIRRHELHQRNSNFGRNHGGTKIPKK